VDLHGDRLSRRSVTKPEAASEARREIARNAPPSVVFYETAVDFFFCKNGNADKKWLFSGYCSEKFLRLLAICAMR